MASPLEIAIETYENIGIKRGISFAKNKLFWSIDQCEIEKWKSVVNYLNIMKEDPEKIRVYLLISKRRSKKVNLKKFPR